jgi:hypothetical protein
MRPTGDDTSRRDCLGGRTNRRRNPEFRGLAHVATLHTSKPYPTGSLAMAMVCGETRGCPRGAPAAFGRHAPRTVTSADGLRSDAYGDWLLLVIGGCGRVFAVVHLHSIEEEAQHGRHDQIGDERVQRRISSERARGTQWRCESKVPILQQDSCRMAERPGLRRRCPV